MRRLVEVDLTESRQPVVDVLRNIMPSAKTFCSKAITVPGQRQTAIWIIRPAETTGRGKAEFVETNVSPTSAFRVARAWSL
jgi:hypothetical protein